MKQIVEICIRVGVMVFNATINTIQLYCWGQFYWLRKPEYSEKTPDLTQVTKGNNKITELRTILQRESQNS